MRPIKFRITYQHGETGRITQKDIDLGQPIPHLGNDWNVVAKDQYTGLKAKNGEICERDILQREGYSYLHEVRWHNQSCGFNLTWIFDSLNAGWDVKIIGNIYENPELLETTP